MPAPDDFDGNFYSLGIGGIDELFDYSPEEFIQMCIEHENPFCSAEFFVAGALADLLWLATPENDYLKRYRPLFEAAAKKWPTHYWSAIPIVIITARTIISEGADIDQVGNGVCQTIGNLFGAAEIHTVGDAVVIQGRGPAQRDKTIN